MPSLEHLPAVGPAEAGWRAWTGALLDLVFPPFCPVCRALLGDGRRDPLCGRCWRGLERIAGPVCRVCGLPFGAFGSQGGAAARGRAGAVGRAAVPGRGEQIGEPGSPPPAMPEPDASRAHRCGSCRRRRPAFAYARAAARYGDTVREALHAFKFGGRRALAAPLGDLLAGIGRGGLPVEAPDLLVPVPLHRRRERERGFNQALLLAPRLGRAWGLPVRADVLLRTAATGPQADLSAEARHANVRGAFALSRPEAVAGRHVIVVDDIFTTGATVAECARCLLDGGAATVGVLTVARVL